MSLTPHTLMHVAHLARLNLSDAEVETYTQELNHILKMIDALNQLDTQQVEPMAHPLDCTQRLRDDGVTEPNVQDAALALAPKAAAGLFLVPQVIE